MANNKIREEEVKNRIRQEFFQDYDATPILGDIEEKSCIRVKPMQLFCFYASYTQEIQYFLTFICRGQVLISLQATSKGVPWRLH